MSVTHYLDRLYVTVVSPDGRLGATTVADDLVDIEFRGDPRLDDYTPEALADQAAAGSPEGDGAVRCRNR